jgi:EAL domain-containing protein (putative c-di-GMP-specific phosphodiesterase class I)
VGTHELHITPSIGVSFFPQDADDAEVLMRNADLAMYEAKKMGGNTCQFFTARMVAGAQERRELQSKLHGALERREMVLYYQPQVDITDGKVIGVEALLRWRDPGGQMISPARFIPLAEETGLIVPIGEWVLNEACRQAMELRKAGAPRFRMAVNLSARQFAAPGLVELVAAALKESGLPPEDLELEITESTAMRDAEETARLLDELRKLGVRIAIDDFGTGYSSLVYLRRFTCDTLKIGQAFTRDVADREDYAAILAAIFGLASALKLETVVAEGIETEKQLDILKQVDCRVVQGFYFWKPMPAEQLESALRGGTPQKVGVA